MSGVTYQMLGYHETSVRVRFGEVDHYGYLWHGHALAHFECLRVELARTFGFRTPDLIEAELILPMLEASCVYKNPSFEDEELLIQGTVLKSNIPNPFLVIIYRAVKAHTGQEAFRGRTRQVFMRRDGRMITRLPDVMRDRMAQLWTYLEKRPRWPDADALAHSFTNPEAAHVICPA